MRIQPEITGVAIVLLGNFNPSIFTPAWFGWHELLPEKTVEIAELQIAQSQITSFEADWLKLQAVSDRFTISTTQPPFVRLLDLAIRVFREQLPHTRLQAAGINREVHFLVNSYKERDHIGRSLAPIEPWGEWGDHLEPDGNYGGMASLTMTQVNLQGRPPGGRINVTVENSNRVGEGQRGVFVRVNDHYVVEDPESQEATSELISMLEQGYDESIRRAERIIDHVMSLGRV